MYNSPSRLQCLSCIVKLVPVLSLLCHRILARQYHLWRLISCCLPVYRGDYDALIWFNDVNVNKHDTQVLYNIPIVIYI